MDNKRAGKPWSEEEKEYLEENYMDMTDEEMGEELGRGGNGVCKKRIKFGLEKFWSEKEIQYLKDNFLDQTISEIGEILDRTIGAIYKKANNLGLKKAAPLWSKEEVLYLKNNFLNKTDKEIAEKLGRTEGAIGGKRNKLELIKRPASGPWTEEEVQHLRENYLYKSLRRIGKELGRGKQGVSYKLHDLGLCKPKLIVRRYDLWEKRDDICELYKQGQSINAISKKYQACRITICLILSACNIEFKSKKYEYYQSVQHKINQSMQRGFRRTIKNLPTSHSWTEYVDYSVEDLKEHLESQFKDGMSWNNYGSEWHIDHKRPIVSFNFSSTEDEDFQRCWSLSNLQPLWGPDNISKGAKWDGQTKLFF